jgi:hypothetical protein
MNIFVLDYDPATSAFMHCDKHVVKMILESAQMICTTHHLTSNGMYYIPYRPVHKNHPCTVWVRESLSNYEWLMSLTYWLNFEYRYRFNRKVNHKSYDAIISLPKPNIKDKGLTPFALAMPDECKMNDAVDSYINYYNTHKSHLLMYTKRKPNNLFPSATQKVGGKEMNVKHTDKSIKGERVVSID